MADDDQKSERAAEVTGAHGHHHHHEPDGETPSGHVDHDPVCGMVVDHARTAHKAEYEGERYAFCSAGCKAKFDADPVHYAARVASPVGTAKCCCASMTPASSSSCGAARP